RMVWGIGFAAAALTAFYMFRLYYMTFHGSFRGTHEQEHHLHESPGSMTVPLMVLAAGSVVAGFAGVPKILGGGNWIEGFLEPVFEPAHHALREVFSAPEPHLEGMLMLASVALAALGIGLATLVYLRQPAVADRLAASFPGLHRLLSNKYYVDELYDAVFVRGLALGGGERLYDSDRYVVDGAGGGRIGPGLGVNGIGWAARDLLARLSNLFDRWFVDGAVNTTAAVFDNGSYLFRAVQNGLVQQYVLVMFMGVLVLIGAGYW